MILLSGVLLASMLGTAVTFTIPAELGVCEEKMRVGAAKGIAVEITMAAENFCRHFLRLRQWVCGMIWIK